MGARAGLLDSPAALCRAQGWYYLVSGVWPIVSMRTFLAVTGPKTDLWLVKTVGALVAVIGATLIVSSRHQRGDEATAVLACGSAGALATIEAVYAGRGRIAGVYLLDAALELGLVAGWAYLWSRDAARARP